MSRISGANRFERFSSHSCGSQRIDSRILLGDSRSVKTTRIAERVHWCNLLLVLQNEQIRRSPTECDGAGILPDCLVTVVNVQWFGSTALELTYKTPSGKLANELIYRHDEPRTEVIEHGRPWSFDGDGSLFRLVSEAHRIRLAICSTQSWQSTPPLWSRFRTRSQRSMTPCSRANRCGSCLPTTQERARRSWLGSLSRS